MGLETKLQSIPAIASKVEFFINWARKWSLHHAYLEQSPFIVNQAREQDKVAATRRNLPLRGTFRRRGRFRTADPYRVKVVLYH